MNYQFAEPQDKWILSTYDRTPAMAVNPEGTLCQSRDAAWSGIRTTQGVVNKGKYFYEATVSDEGLCRVGWSLNEVKQAEFCVVYYFSFSIGVFTFCRLIWILARIVVAMVLVAPVKNLITDNLMITEAPMD